MVLAYHAYVYLFSSIMLVHVSPLYSTYQDWITGFQTLGLEDEERD